MACDAVVVGAGAAGLAAAETLGRAGRKVVMLEARDRAGGRAHSVDVPGHSWPVELGPEFIHGRPEVTLRRLRAFGTAWIDTADASWYAQEGCLVPDESDEDAAASLVRRALTALEPEADRDVASAIRAVSSGEREDDDAEMTVLGMVKGFDAADPERASLRAIGEEWAGDASLETASARPVGGYRALWRAELALLLALAVDLRFGYCVRRVEHDGDEVRVFARDAGGCEWIISAPHVVVTIPLGVLQIEPGPGSELETGTIAFSPPLPERVRSALGQLAMGPVVKAMIAFRTPFWETILDGRLIDAAFLRAPRHAPFRVIWTTLPTRTSVLTAWAGGSDVRPPLDGDESGVIEAVYTTLRAMFGADVEALARTEARWACVHDWQRDPFARGAYSYVLAGGCGSRDILQEPINGRVFFAGEAFAQHGEGGTVAGALTTGEDAARRVLARNGAGEP